MEPGRQQSDGFPMAVVVEGGLALVAAFLAWLFGVRLRDQFPIGGQPLAVAVGRGVLAALPMLALFWIWFARNGRRCAICASKSNGWFARCFPPAARRNSP